MGVRPDSQGTDAKGWSGIMTLIRQFSLVILLQIVAVMIGAAFISMNSLREHLTNEMNMRAEITAASLVESLKPVMASGDTTLVNAMINAMFDQGYFREISVESADGDVLAGREKALTFEGLPQWFVNLVRMRPQAVVQPITTDGKVVGRVKVLSHPGSGYHDLWSNAIKTVIWVLATGLILFLVIMFILRKVKHSLSAVEQQAHAISQRHFVINDDQPRSRELANVASAMNNLSHKVKDMLKHQSQLAESLRKQLFLDTVTGLHNRHSFETRVSYFLDSPEHGDDGVVILFQYDNLRKYRDIFGYEDTDSLLRSMGRIIQAACKDHSAVMARLTGAEFIVYLEQCTARDAIGIVDQVCNSYADLEQKGEQDIISGPKCGIAVTRVDSSYSDLLRAADIALQVAKRPSWEKSWHIYGDKSDQQVTEYSEERWRQNLQEAITHHHITFLSQPALDANSGETLHMEMLARLPDEQGEQIPASVFIPVADRVDMRQQLDREIIDTWFRTVERNGVLTRSVLNIGIPSLLDDEFLAWLLGRIATNPVASAMLTLEVSATALGNKRDAVLEVVRELREQHIGFAFDHFGSAHVDISYLSSFLLCYFYQLLSWVLTAVLRLFPIPPATEGRQNHIPAKTRHVVVHLPGLSTWST
ncbi:MAG: hypothetical protein DSZ33_00200 [Gammaproteobacteria bacterium]|nr:MAG: hypothetical protein DSZ33_00200 [Gammaproteobacteria bacterium]